MTAKQLYRKVTSRMNAKARYKLANWLAHGYELQGNVLMTVVVRNDEYLLIDKHGNLWKAQKAI